MSNLYQDITITLDLSEMSPEEYKKILKQLNEISMTKPNTYTYDTDNMSEEQLSVEHLKLLKTMTD